MGIEIVGAERRCGKRFMQTDSIVVESYVYRLHVCVDESPAKYKLRFSQRFFKLD